jgi:hypothetical protein
VPEVLPDDLNSVAHKLELLLGRYRRELERLEVVDRFLEKIP